MVFVPRVVEREDIEYLVDALGRGRLSLISPPGAALPVSEMEALGVARVSTGPFTQRVALTALQDAAAAMYAGGVAAAGHPRTQLSPGTRRAHRRAASQCQKSWCGAAASSSIAGPITVVRRRPPAKTVRHGRSMVGTPCWLLAMARRPSSDSA